MTTAEFLLLCFAGSAVLAVLLWEDRRRGAELRQLRRVVAERERHASLFLRDLTGAGLALLGQSQTVQGGQPIEAAARRILALADGAAETLLDHGRVRALRETSFALGELVREAVSHAEAQLAPGRRHWRVAPSLDGECVTGDRRALLAALVEVLGRAARMTRDGDWVDIRIERRGEATSIVVEDEGAGLLAEDLAPQADAGERVRGLGLGLSLARSLLRAHGGDLAMEAAPGVGARAYLTLPSARVLPA